MVPERNTERTQMITPQQGIADAAPLPRGAAGAPGPAPTITTDFETFLRMLTVQMQNQNPLNPMESQEFAVQLATFSGVEQQVRGNQLLEALSTRMGMSELAGWVGMEALSDAPVRLTGTPVELVAPQVPGADRARLIVHNAFGTEVARQEIDPAARHLVFDGIGADGFALPPGEHTFHIESLHMGEVIASNPALSYARVQEARFDSGAIMLMLAGGGMIDSARVQGLRGPG